MRSRTSIPTTLDCCRPTCRGPTGGPECVRRGRGGLRSDRERVRPEPSRSPGTERLDDAEAAREAALRLLERTRRTRSDLARRLREKGFGGPVIEEVLGRLGEVGLVDDAEYAR